MKDLEGKSTKIVSNLRDVRVTRKGVRSSCNVGRFVNASRFFQGILSRYAHRYLTQRLPEIVLRSLAPWISIMRKTTSKKFAISLDLKLNVLSASGYQIPFINMVQKGVGYSNPTGESTLLPIHSNPTSILARLSEKFHQNMAWKVGDPPSEINTLFQGNKTSGIEHLGNHARIGTQYKLDELVRVLSRKEHIDSITHLRRIALPRPQSTSWYITPVVRVYQHPTGVTKETRQTIDSQEDSSLFRSSPSQDRPFYIQDQPQEFNVNHLADQVVRVIDQRIIARRERLGRV